MFAATGSTITAAIAPRCCANSLFHRARSLYGAFSVSARNASRHARAGRNAQRRQSRTRLRQKTVRMPVVAALEFQNRIARVTARARRTALMVASVPELTKRTFSTDGSARAISSASSTSSGVVMP